MKFDINYFKDYISVWEKISKPFTINKWDFASLWKLSKILRLQPHELKQQEAVSWVDEYNPDGPWSAALPKRPISSITELDFEVQRVWKLLDEVHMATLKFAGSRAEIVKMGWGENRIEESVNSDVKWNLDLLNS